MKQGTDRNTGRLISGVPYLWQRLSDVISTPVGSLVGRREFGSRLFEMLDRNVDGSFYMDAYIRLAEAINNPANGLDDFTLATMRVDQPAQHHVEIYISGRLLVDGRALDVELEGIPYARN
jgi:phage baseplate assembly protein W